MRGKAKVGKNCALTWSLVSLLRSASLRSALAQKLPNYMIPAHFVQLPQMPLTPNDKIDRKALPAPEGNALTGGEYVAPRNEAERTLADVWQAVLNADRVGVTDHFFEPGRRLDQVHSSIFAASSSRVQAGNPGFVQISDDLTA